MVNDLTPFYGDLFAYLINRISKCFRLQRRKLKLQRGIPLQTLSRQTSSCDECNGSRYGW